MGRNHQFDLRPLSGSNQSKLTISLRTGLQAEVLARLQLDGQPDRTKTQW